MKLYQKILIGIVGIFAFPALAIGGSIVNSLINGKSVPEAIEILIGQVESLTARVSFLTTRVEKLEKAMNIEEKPEVKVEPTPPPTKSLPEEGKPEPKKLSEFPSALQEKTDEIIKGTEVGGIISEDTIWTLEKSPYIITGNILIKEGVKLIIEPGVRIQFEKHPIPFKGYNIEIDGTLIAKGTEDKRIIFTSANKNSGDWGTIYFSDKSTDWNEENKTGNIIEHCIIEYGGSSQGGGADVMQRDTLIGIDNSSPLIKDCVLRSGDEKGGDALRINGSPKIINNKIQSGRIVIWGGSPYFSSNKISGAGFYIVGGSPIITKNDIVNNHGDTYGGGIRIDGGSPIISYNNIVNNSDNGISIVTCHCDLQRTEKECKRCSPTIEYNNIYNNKRFSIILTDTKYTFDFPNNWWGTTDTSSIDSLIYDYYDDFNLGKVNYQPIATSEILNAGSQ